MKKLLALLIVPVLLATPVFAQDKDKTPTKEDIILKKLDDLQKSLDGISKDLRKDVNEAKKDIASLRADLESMKAEIASLRKTPNVTKDDTKLKPAPRVEVTRTPYRIGESQRRYYDDDDEDDEALRERIARLERSRKAPSVRVTYSNPPEVQYGKIRFINTYHLSYTVTVNGERYTAKAGDTLIVDYVMPGEFTYQVHGVTDPRRRTLSPNEMFTVTIHPQQSNNSHNSYYARSPATQSYPVYSPCR